MIMDMFPKQIHDHSLRHRILGSNMTTINAAYPWSFHYHTEYLVQLWLRQAKYIHDHSLPHRILGSTLITTNGTYTWSFITCLNQVFCVVMNDHGYVSFVVVMVEPSILCGNEWSWICFLCRNQGWTKYSVW
jgi:hypothetical protein